MVLGETQQRLRRGFWGEGGEYPEKTKSTVSVLRNGLKLVRSGERSTRWCSIQFIPQVLKIAGSACMLEVPSYSGVRYIRVHASTIL